MQLIEFIGLPNHHYVLEDQILLEIGPTLFSWQEVILAHGGEEREVPHFHSKDCG